MLILVDKLSWGGILFYDLLFKNLFIYLFLVTTCWKRILVDDEESNCCFLAGLVIRSLSIWYDSEESAIILYRCLDNSISSLY